MLKSRVWRRGGACGSAHNAARSWGYFELAPTSQSSLDACVRDLDLHRHITGGRIANLA